MAAQTDGKRRTPPHGDDTAPRTDAGEGPSVARLRERGREVRDEGRAFADAAGGLAEEVQALARVQMRERPYWMLGAAFAAGWVLGGGVPPTAARLAGEAATRAATHALASRLARAMDDAPDPPAGD